MIPKSPGAVLREAVHGVTIPVPGAFNALVGRMLEQAGYDAIYLSGAAFRPVSSPCPMWGSSR